MHRASLLFVFAPAVLSFVCTGTGGPNNHCCLPALPSGDQVCTSVTTISQGDLYFNFSYDGYTLMFAQYTHPIFGYSKVTECLSTQGRSACFSPIYTTFIPYQTTKSPACGAFRQSAYQAGNLISNMFYFQLSGDCIYDGPANAPPAITDKPQEEVAAPVRDICSKCKQEGCSIGDDNQYVCCANSNTLCLEIYTDSAGGNVLVDTDVEFKNYNWMRGSLTYTGSDTQKSQVHCTVSISDYMVLSPLCVNYTLTSFSPYSTEISYSFEGNTYYVGSAKWTD